MKEKLHILFLSHWYPSRVSPTNGDFIQRHAEAVATKHKVTLIHVVTDENLKILREIIEFTKNNVQTYIVYQQPTQNIIIKFYRFFKSYLKIIKKVKGFDLVHLNITFPVGLIALYLKWFKKKPYVISEHWTGYQRLNKLSIGCLQLFTTKIITKNAAIVCPVSKNLQQKMISLGLLGNYYPVPNVVNNSIFNIDKNSFKNFTITHISHMGNEHKNIEGILNVLLKLQFKIPNLKIHLIGNNIIPFKNILEKINQNSITILGQISNATVADYLKKSSVFVLFSNYENLPCVILESFACGVPVISTNVGGISEYFPNDFGYLINPKDEIALENSILKVYKNELKYNKEIMHQYAENNFGIKHIGDEFSTLYTKILSN